MLKRLLLLGLAVAILSFVRPCLATIDPLADIVGHQVSQPTTEATLDQQIAATMVLINGAYAGAGETPPTPAETLADSFTKVFHNIPAGGNQQTFTLNKFDATKTINGNPAVLQGVLLYFTVTLKSGRQVIDNESAQKVNGAIVQIGVNLSTWCYDPALTDFGFQANPRVTKIGNLAADTNGPDYGPPSYYPNIATMTAAQIEAASTGADRLAAIIDPNDPANSTSKQPIYTVLSSQDAAALAAFVYDGTGATTLTFAYDSDPYQVHQAASQDVIDWVVPPTFDIEARVVYLYAAASVPEPASIGLLSAALLPMLTRRLRKTKQIS
jgi:hypothetical protein